MEAQVKLPDVSQWYTPERIAAEQEIWLAGQHYKENAGRIAHVCREYSLFTVLEFGCGTGLIPGALPPDVSYMAGVDANPHMIEMASGRNPNHTFVQSDIRDLKGAAQADLSCAFAVIKHFSLAEWPAILQIVLAHGRYSLFNMHALPDDREPFDAGKEWHSAWPRRSDIIAAVSAAGHKVLSWDDSHVDPGVSAPESYIVTRRIHE
jgi:predicted TPR repeat methyltransferase